MNNNVNCNAVSDSDIIESLILNAKDGFVEIGIRHSEYQPERNYWLIDRAILIPANTTVVLKNCKIKLSDKCRDNFFRSANCTGVVGENVEKISNVHIIGQGYCVLEGADHPRSTGDSSKTLKCPCPKTAEDMSKYATWIDEEQRKNKQFSFDDFHNITYGTDTSNENESQRGDWRNIGILMVSVNNFSIENVHIVESHGWGISLEDCAFGEIDRVDFDAKMQREIDGFLHNIENQDGIDLRNGCHDITISNITGQTGDDLIALTAIAAYTTIYKNGELKRTQYLHNDWSKRDKDIHNVIITNVKGRSQGGAIGDCCSMIRLLPVETKIYNVVLDNIINVHEDGLREDCTLLLGTQDSEYGRNPQDGLTNITISNVICDSKIGIKVDGYLKDSVINNVISKNQKAKIIKVNRETGLNNVSMNNILTSVE